MGFPERPPFLSDNKASVMGEYIDLECRCLTAALEVKTISHVA